MSSILLFRLDYKHRHLKLIVDASKPLTKLVIFTIGQNYTT